MTRGITDAEIRYDSMLGVPADALRGERTERGEPGVLPQMVEWVGRERIAATADQVALIAVASAIAGIFVAWLLRAEIASPGLLLWLAAHLFVAAWRHRVAQRFRADAGRSMLPREWVLRFEGLAVAAGLLWAVPIVALHASGGEALRLVGTAFMLALPLFALISQRFFSAGTIGFVAGCLGIPVLYLALFGDAPYRMELAAAALAYGVALALISRRVEATNIALLQSRYQGERFVAELRTAKDLADAATQAKSEFLSRVSHELRTPLTIVLGMSQLLKSSRLDAEQIEGLDMIERAGESLLALISQLLDLSEVEAGRLTLERADFDLRRAIEPVSKQIAAEAALKGLRFELHVADTLPGRVRGDERRLRQVLRNLADNAVKFTPSGGIELRVEQTLENVPAGRVGVKFSVTDTGIGMDKGLAARVFEPFFQAESALVRRYGGTGLGLAMSRELVRLMGGTMSLQTEPGKGSTFSFTASFESPLVVADGATGRMLDAALPGRIPVRVLLVEDEPVSVAMTTSFLKTAVDHFDVAESGEDALRAFEAQTYDVVLMDCIMPGLDGYEAARRMRGMEKRLGRHCHIVALTASAMPEDRDRCFAAGMDAFMSKPFRLTDLRSALLRGARRH